MENRKEYLVNQVKNKNYIHLKHFSLFHQYFFYVDTIDYAVADFIMKNKIGVKVIREYVKEPNPYLICVCKVKNKDVDSFTNVLDRFTKASVLAGRSNYSNFCNELFTEMVDASEKI